LRNAWTSFKNEGTLKAMACSVRRRGNLIVRDVDYRTGRVDQTDGQKLKTYQTSLGFFDLAIAAPLHESSRSLARSLAEGSIHGVDAGGQAVIRRQLKRYQVLAFFQKQPPGLVGIEACASSHH
jgi:hypothetical protein